MPPKTCNQQIMWNIDLPVKHLHAYVLAASTNNIIHNHKQLYVAKKVLKSDATISTFWLLLASVDTAISHSLPAVFED